MSPHYVEHRSQVAKMFILVATFDGNVVDIAVTPRFHEYGDVTATYIRRSKIAPHVYTLSKKYNKKQSTRQSVVSIHMPTQRVHIQSYHRILLSITQYMCITS